MYLSEQTFLLPGYILFHKKFGIINSIMKNVLLILTAFFFFLQQPSQAEEFRFSLNPNKAHLITWRDWSGKTLAEAKEKDRIILLSVSSIGCRWCDVMDETTYSDKEVIAYLNEQVIPVRIDSDMRPDIDALYNQGGWPGTVILTPDGEVISGGTYFLSEDLLVNLTRAISLYNNGYGSTVHRLADIQAQCGDPIIVKKGAGVRPTKADLGDITRLVKTDFDSENGEFGTGQKFPDSDAIDFLLSAYARNKDRQIRSIIVRTLDRMDDDGFLENTESGFFRYARKPDWLGPHEKMLEINAGLIRNYARASQLFGIKKYATIAQKTVQYVRFNLQDAASGAFYENQDADDGLSQRQERKGPQPARIERTVYADSSSLMISGLLSLYEATGRKEYLDNAIKSADFLLRQLYSAEDGVCHYFRRGSPRQKVSLLSDNALFGSALLDLYNETGRTEYMNTAKEIGLLITTRFFDRRSKMFRSSLAIHVSRPPANGVLLDFYEDIVNYRAIRFLTRLEYLGGIESITEARDAALATLGSEYRKHSRLTGIFGTVLLWTAGEPVQITILVRSDSARTYLDAIRGVYPAEKSVRVLSLLKDSGEIARLGYTARESVYLCAGGKCSSPITNLDHLKSALSKKSVSGL